MDGTAPFTPQAWESFYVIVGSSAGALTGLQFVVLTLITEAGMIRGTSETLSAFASPNVVHFCAALLVSAMLSAPWQDLAPPGIAVAVAGVGGFAYSAVVLRRAVRQRDYKPVLEDWIWHAALPLIAYAALVYAGIQLARVSVDALFIVGGAALLLVFIGIHNAWDTVTYVMLERARERKAKSVVTRAGERAGERPSVPGSAPGQGRSIELSGPPPA
jgi:hypothetical protein